MPHSSPPRPPADRKNWSAEKLAAARKIEKLMEFWQIRPSELRGPLPPRPEGEASAPAAAPGGPKYRHPHTGETWDGVGSQPEWLRHALLKEGLRPEELRVHDEPSPADAAQPAGAADPADAAEARA